MIFIIKFYKKWLSPMKRTPTCIFYPTCSTYALTAYERHGFFLGTILSFWRIIRCNPFGKGGYDPVPTNIRINRGGKIDEIK
ncbi:MAG: membrane protein insertion efficiency factor YidD [Thermotogota bacterium]|nr:membrane protein insertion efficiency factor YidD [Thermotogota bacterium]